MIKFSKQNRRKQQPGMQAFAILVRQYRKQLAGILVLSFASVFLRNVVVIELTGDITESITEGKGAESVRMIILFATVYIIYSLADCTASLMQVKFSKKIGLTAEREFLGKYAEIYYADYYFDREKVAGQIRKGCEGAENGALCICNIISLVAGLVISVIYLSYLSFYAVIVCVFMSFIFIAVLNSDNRRLPGLYEKFNVYAKTLYGKQWEQIRNHKWGRFFRQEKVIAPYNRMVDSFMEDLRDIKKIANRSMLVSRLGTDVIIVIVAGLGAALFFYGTADKAEVLQIILCVTRLAGSMFSIPNMRNSWQSSRGDIKVMDDIYIETERQKRKGVKKIRLTDVETLSGRGLTFGYTDSSKKVLENLDFIFYRGLNVIRGASGRGKSTLFRIIGGELPVLHGEIVLGEEEVTSDKIYDVFDSVEYMAQTPVILKASIKDNIVMGRNYDEERFKSAVKLAELSEFIAKAEFGQDQTVSDDSLSSGEKQKIAIARVIYQNKPVWILDEPVSAVDEKAAKNIMKNLADLGKEKIILLSTHLDVTESETVTFSL
ncbi:MAG TPA: ABC transporter ATP-binding protein/permease [Candidatus Avanaerovorax faecigallinarum]|nr:ABC transporter ATP-binding protein/permease [Candidatus Avanaerovorax faecigallinarum]